MLVPDDELPEDALIEYVRKHENALVQRCVRELFREIHETEEESNSIELVGISPDGRAAVRRIGFGVIALLFVVVGIALDRFLR